MKTDTDRWLEEEAGAALEEAGIREGQTVLDFGCGPGYYTIPSAKIVGDKGVVYALDKNKTSLNEVAKRAKPEKLNNILRIKTSGKSRIPLEDESVDVILLYDVIHSYYFSATERKKLLAEIYRISKPGALISVYPRHMNLEDVKDEMEKADFPFEKRLFVTLLHDKALTRDYLLNFRLSRQ